MWRHLKKLFHCHKWKILAREEGEATYTGLFGGTERRVMVLEKCGKCGAKRAYLIGLVGEKEYVNIDWLEGAMKKPPPGW